PAHLFEVKPAVRFVQRGVRWPSRAYVAPNPPFGAAIYYYLGAKPRTSPLLTIIDAEGTIVTELKATVEPGLNPVQWDLLIGKSDDEEPRLVPPGEYVVKLQIGERSFTRRVRIDAEE